jgi:hypothetical protein
VRSIQTIIDTLPDEEWFVQVHNWRSSEFGAADAWYSYLDGHDWQVQCAEHDRRQPEDPDVPRVPLTESSTAPGSDGDREPSDQPVSAGAPTGGADGEMAVSR